MRTLEFGEESSLSQILESIKAAEEEDITLNLPEESPIHLNPINKEISGSCGNRSAAVG